MSNENVLNIKKKSQLLKQRAKELGYDIKLTHAQEMMASVFGHESRHSALLQDKKNITNFIEDLRTKRKDGFITYMNRAVFNKTKRSDILKLIDEALVQAQELGQIKIVKDFLLSEDVLSHIEINVDEKIEFQDE